MGLFSRINASANGQDDFNEIDLPTSNDLKGGLFTSEKPNTTTPTAPQSRSIPSRDSSGRGISSRSSSGRGSYGIEDAIKLMKSLPRDNNEIVVSVVKKTLESTQIRVQDIVTDANQKETRIRNQHKTLEGEIKDLQDQIAHRNQQISDLSQDLNETTDVRQRLQLAMELDGEATPVAQAQAAASQAAVPNTETEARSQAAVNSPVSDHADAGTDQRRLKRSQSGTVNPVGDQNLRRRTQPHSNPPH